MLQVELLRVYEYWQEVPNVEKRKQHYKDVNEIVHSVVLDNTVKIEYFVSFL